MKNRVNQILLAAALVTAALHAFFLLAWLELLPFSLDTPFRYSSLGAHLGLSFHVIPCFCLQLLVCRTVKRPMVRLIPVFLLFGAVGGFIIGFVNSYLANDWGAIVWGILLCLCIAPAVGYALAWAVYGIRRLCQHTNK